MWLVVVVVATADNAVAAVRVSTVAYVVSDANVAFLRWKPYFKTDTHGFPLKASTQSACDLPVLRDVVLVYYIRVLTDIGSFSVYL